MKKLGVLSPSLPRFLPPPQKKIPRPKTNIYVSRPVQKLPISSLPQTISLDHDT